MIKMCTPMRLRMGPFAISPLSFLSSSELIVVVRVEIVNYIIVSSLKVFQSQVVISLQRVNIWINPYKILSGEIGRKFGYYLNRIIGNLPLSKKLTLRFSNKMTFEHAEQIRLCIERGQISSAPTINLKK
jgi:hypothetical protein